MKKWKTLLLLSTVGLLTLASPALTASAAWKTTSAGKMYTQSASPGYVTGFKTIGKYTYYFNSKGIMQTGFVTIKKKPYYFNAKGRLQYGWFIVNGKKYYADSDGVLAVETWVGNYYLQEDGSMAVSTWVEGKWVGSDGRYTGIKNNVGFVTDNGVTVYYDQNHKIVKGWLTVSGNTYYMNASTGYLMKGWITVSGRQYYAETKKGVIQKSIWIGKKYLTSTGALASAGFLEISGKTYLFDSSGQRQSGYVKYNGVTYYLNKKGVLQKNKWMENNTKYIKSDGSLALGMTAIGSKTYYFGSSTGIKKYGWKTIGGNRYYFKKKTGVLQKNRWLSSKTYYASSTGAILKGLNTIGNNIYYFNLKTGRKVTNKKKTVSGYTYYFQSDGTAAKSKWVEIKKKYYYFQADGTMAKNTWIGNYYVDLKGARSSSASKTTGWVTVGNSKYYFDSNGTMVTGWQTISGSKYYFSSTGVMLTGIQTIGSKKYYFYSDGKMAASITIIVGATQYTINKNGVIKSELSLKITENTVGDKIVNFALQYVGNPYVYGGTSLTNGADCSGFVQTVFANFGIKLLRVADDQMKGPSSAYIKLGYKAAVVVDMSSIKPGDLIFYGSSSYASHVGIYIGNGKIVHASNSAAYPSGGIKVSAYNYTTPVRAVRYWS